MRTVFFINNLLESSDDMITALKSLFSYIYMIVLLRLLGKKECSQLSMYDFVVFLLIADLMVMGFDGDMTDAVISTAVLVFTDAFSSYLSLKSKRIRDFIEGTPTHIVINGKLNIEAMRKNKYTCDSLAQHLRQRGISSLSEVAFATLETNGQLSIIKQKDNQVKAIEPVIMDGVIMHAMLKNCGYDEQWLRKNLKDKKPEDVMYAVIEKERLYVVEK